MFFQENEMNFVKIYNMNMNNSDEKDKWLTILDTFPFYVMIYNKRKEAFVYTNNRIKAIDLAFFNK